MPEKRQMRYYSSCLSLVSSVLLRFYHEGHKVHEDSETEHVTSFPTSIRLLQHDRDKPVHPRCFQTFVAFVSFVVEEGPA